jgi:hypothetical protein
MTTPAETPRSFVVRAALPMGAARGSGGSVSHRLGGCGEKMPPVGELDGVVRAEQTQVRFVNEACGIERLTRPLGRHLCSRDSSKLVVHEWQQSLGRLRLPGVDVLEDFSHIAHAGQYTTTAMHAFNGSPRDGLLTSLMSQ